MRRSELIVLITNGQAIMLLHLGGIKERDR